MIPNWKLTTLRTSQDIILRPLMPYDVTPAYVEGMNDPKVHEFMTTKKHTLASVWEYVTQNWICIFDKRYWEKGIAPSAIARVIEFAASDLRLREINAGIEAGNIGSQKAFKKAGFTRIADKAAAQQYRWSGPE
jgi:L-amino acid N-acyltransferase YncA